MTIKQCSNCKLFKAGSDFRPEPRSKSGLSSRCTECCQRADAETQHKRVTLPVWFLRKRYTVMRGRTTGVIHGNRNYNTWIGKPILPLQDFLDWSLTGEGSKKFWLHWNTWQLAGRPYKLTPSIDRLDNELGYTIDPPNMEWTTHSVNSARGAASRVAA